MIDLLDVAPPERIAEMLGHGVGPFLVERMLDRPALRRSLSRLLQARLAVDSPGDARREVALALDRDGVTDLATRAGIVWHSTPIAEAIDANARSALVAEIGEDHYRLALAARRELPPTPSSDSSLETIRSSVAHEGIGCLSAWLEVQPPCLADRLRLYWPSVQFGDAHRRLGPGIVDWLLGGPAA